MESNHALEGAETSQILSGMDETNYQFTLALLLMSMPYPLNLFNQNPYGNITYPEDKKLKNGQALSCTRPHHQHNNSKKQR